jgi:prepilin-type processing-associated H-X9-DG protein
MVVVAVLGILAGLLLPALAKSREAAHRAQCIQQLRQFGLAGQMYWDDHQGRSFNYGGLATNGGKLYWFGWLQAGAEGQRVFDRTRGVLHPYIGSARVELCPSLNRSLDHFKNKATGAAYGYGYNLHLSAPLGQPAVSVAGLNEPSAIVFLADSAQVNDFQPPASPAHPMLEEFYYVSANENESTAHFRHQVKANAVFCDGHVESERGVPDGWDRRMPQHHVGRLRREILVW